MSLNRKGSTDAVDTVNYPTSFPINGAGLRGYWARRDVCPECGHDLNTGWECIACGYDAAPDAQPDSYLYWVSKFARFWEGIHDALYNASLRTQPRHGGESR